MKINAEKSGCNRHVKIEKNEYFKLFRISLENHRFFWNSKKFIVHFKLNTIPFIDRHSLCYFHKNHNSLFCFFLRLHIFVLYEVELCPLLTEVDEAVGRLRWDVEVVPPPDGEESVVDDDTELPLQDEEDEGGQAGVGDPLGAARRQSEEGGEVVGRPEGETLLDGVLCHPVTLTADVGPGQLGVTDQTALTHLKLRTFCKHGASQPLWD